MSGFFINCNCPAPEPCIVPAHKSKSGKLMKFTDKEKYERHIRDRHADLIFDPKNIILPAYKDPGTPSGFLGSSFKWCITPLHELNDEGIQKWVILKIPRARAEDADVNQLNVSGLSLSGIHIF